MPCTPNQNDRKDLPGMVAMIYEGGGWGWTRVDSEGQKYISIVCKPIGYPPMRVLVKRNKLKRKPNHPDWICIKTRKFDFKEYEHMGTALKQKLQKETEKKLKEADTPQS
jgi:hypothetical protein